MRQAISQVFRGHGRTLSFVLIACAGLGLATAGSAVSVRPRHQPVIRVEIYNYAHIDRLQLRQAELQAADLFAMAGGRIVWLDHPEKKSLAESASDSLPADFFVRILYASVVSRVRRISGLDLLGETMASPGSKGPVAGRIANVFYDRVRDVSRLWGLYPAEVLGDAIAHELGHLLGARHSSRGLMKARWTERDLVLAGRDELRFSRSQAALFRRAALRLHHHPSTAVLAQR